MVWNTMLPPEAVKASQVGVGGALIVHLLICQCHSFPAHVDSFWADLQLFTRNNSDLEKMRIHMLTATDQHSIPIPGLEQSSTSSGRTMFGHHDDDEDTKDQPLARRGHGTGKLQVTSSFSFRDMAIVSPELLSLFSSRSQVP